MKQIYFIFALSIFLNASFAESPAEMHQAPEPICDKISQTCANKPSAVFDHQGNLWVSWVQQGRIYIQSSKDSGKHFSKPIPVNQEAENILTHGENRPKIKVGLHDELYLTWTLGLEKRFTSLVRFARSLDGGKTFSKPMTLNDDHEIIGHSFESLSVGRDGKLLIAWIDGRDANAAKSNGQAFNGSSIYYTWSDDSGAHFKPNKNIAARSCQCCRLQTAIDIDDLPVVVWRHIYPENIRDHALVKFMDWDKPGKINRISHENWKIEGCPHHGPGLSIASNGRFHFTWFSNAPEASGIFYAYSDDIGRHFTHPLAIGIQEGVPSHPHVLSLGKRVVLVWTAFNGQKNQLKWMNSVDGGENWLPSKQLAETEGGVDSPFLLENQGKFYVSWATEKNGLQIIPLQ